MIAFGKSVCVSELHANIWRWHKQPASVSESPGLCWPVNVKYCYLFIYLFIFCSKAWETCTAESWCKNAAEPWLKVQHRGFECSNSSPSYAPHTAALPLWSHILHLCGSTEERTGWTALAVTAQGWNGRVVLFTANAICSSALTDGNIVKSLVCPVDVCFPRFSFCSPRSVRVLGVPCGLSEQSILGGGKQADVLTPRSMPLISEWLLFSLSPSLSPLSFCATWMSAS